MSIRSRWEVLDVRLLKTDGTILNVNWHEIDEEIGAVRILH